MSSRPSAAFGIVTVVLTLLGWASVPLFLRHFAEQIDPWTSNGWRYGFSALVWAPVLIYVAVRSGLPRGLWMAALIPSIVNAMGQVCFTYAHYRIDPGLLTFGLRSQLLFVAIGAWLMFPKERAVIRTPGYLLGALVLVIGMIGVVVLDNNDDDDSEADHVALGAVAAAVEHAEHAEAGGALDAAGAENVVSAAPMRTASGAEWGTTAAHVQGITLALASGMLFACYGLAVRKYMEGVHSVLAFAAICQYTALVMVALMFVLGKSFGMGVFEMSDTQFLLLLFSALIGIAIGHVFYYVSIARLGVAVSAGVLQLQPFIVAMGSIPIFGERLSLGQWVGGVVAVSGALLMLGTQWYISRQRRINEQKLAIAEGESGA